MSDGEAPYNLSLAFVQERTAYYNWFFGQTLPSLAVIGFVLNGLCVVIFNHPGLKSSSSIYLCALAVADIGYTSILSLVLTPLFYVDPLDFVTGFTNVFTRYYPTVQIMDALISAYILLALVDHYLFEVGGHGGSKPGRTGNALNLVFAVFSIVLLAHMPNYLYLDTHLATLPNGYEILEVCISSFLDNEVYSMFDKYVYIFLFHGVAMAISLIIVCLLAWHTFGGKKSAVQRRSSRQRVFTNGRSTGIMVALTICRWGFYIPSVINTVQHWKRYPGNEVDITCYERPLDPTFTKWIFPYIVWAFLFNSLGSASRLLIHLTFGQQFRVVFFHVFFRCTWQVDSEYAKRNTLVIVEDGEGQATSEKGDDDVIPTSENMADVVIALMQKRKQRRKDRKKGRSRAWTEPKHAETVEEAMTRIVESTTIMRLARERVFLPNGKPRNIDKNNTEQFNNEAHCNLVFAKDEAPFPTPLSNGTKVVPSVPYKHNGISVPPVPHRNGEVDSISSTVAVPPIPPRSGTVNKIRHAMVPLSPVIFKRNAHPLEFPEQPDITPEITTMNNVITPSTRRSSTAITKTAGSSRTQLMTPTLHGPPLPMTRHGSRPTSPGGHMQWVPEEI